MSLCACINFMKLLNIISVLNSLTVVPKVDKGVKTHGIVAFRNQHIKYKDETL